MGGGQAVFSLKSPRRVKGVVPSLISLLPALHRCHDGPFPAGKEISVSGRYREGSSAHNLQVAARI